jgi:hypothetical protein
MSSVTITVSASTPILVPILVTDATPSKKRKADEPVAVENKREEEKVVEIKNSLRSIRTIDSFIRELQKLPKNLRIESPTLLEPSIRRSWCNFTEPGIDVKYVDDFKISNEFKPSKFDIPTPVLDLFNIDDDGDVVEAKKTAQTIYKDVAIATLQSMLRNDEKLLCFIKDLIKSLQANNYIVTQRLGKKYTLQSISINRYETINSQGKITSISKRIGSSGNSGTGIKNAGVFLLQSANPSWCSLHITSGGQVYERSRSNYPDVFKDVDNNNLLYNTWTTKSSDNTHLLRSVTTSISELEKIVSTFCQ